MRFAETRIRFLPSGPLFGLGLSMWLPLVMICARTPAVRTIATTVGRDRTTVPFWLGTASRDLAAVAVLSENLKWTRLNSIFLRQDFLLLSCIPKMHPAWISLFTPRSNVANQTTTLHLGSMYRSSNSATARGWVAQIGMKKLNVFRLTLLIAKCRENWNGILL
jgi:hypothetical protein